MRPYKRVNESVLSLRQHLVQWTIGMVAKRDRASAKVPLVIWGLASTSASAPAALGARVLYRADNSCLSASDGRVTRTSGPETPSRASAHRPGPSDPFQHGRFRFHLLCTPDPFARAPAG